MLSTPLTEAGLHVQVWAFDVASCNCLPLTPGLTPAFLMVTVISKSEGLAADMEATYFPLCWAIRLLNVGQRPYAPDIAGREPGNPTPHVGGPDQHDRKGFLGTLGW